MALVDRVSSQLAPRGRRRAPSRRDGFAQLSLDDWSALFEFGGIGYPILQTTMGSVNEERIFTTAIGAFQGNTAVFALTAARIQAFSQIMFQWTRFSGSQPGELFGTPALSVLEKPWPNGRTSDLLARMELHNCIAGNAYVVRPRKDRLAMLRPDRVTIVLGSQMDPDYPADAPDVELAGFFYLPRSGNGQLFFPNEVAHYAPLPDPNFQHLGMSWMTPAIREIQADSLATEHKARFFENAATPNLALKFDPTLTVEMVKAFKDLLENEHQGAFNAYKTLYLGGGADPIAIGANFQQMDFANTQGKGESRLAAAAGVPPSWVGFSEGLQGSSLNAGNFNSARRRFSDGTMYHLWLSAAQALEDIVQPEYGQRLWFDNRVPFMREDAGDVAAIQVQQATAISTLVQQGYEPDSVVTAINQADLSLLKHSGLTSVQLHAPGEQQTPPPPVTVGGSDSGGGAAGQSDDSDTDATASSDGAGEGS